MNKPQSLPPWRERPVKTLLVDLDGTLLASRDFPLRADFIARALWSFSRYAGWRRAVRALTGLARALEYPEASEKGMTNAERASHAFAMAIGMDDALGAEVLHQEVAEIFPRLSRHFYPVPGAREFLKWAESRYHLVLATNPVWPLEQVKQRLDWAGIDPNVFSSITHSGRMHACKPSVDYYLELLAQDGLDASDCVLIGDDVRKDLPAVHAGISVFILTSNKSQIRVLKSPKEGPLAGDPSVALARAGSYSQLKKQLEGVRS